MGIISEGPPPRIWVASDWTTSCQITFDVFFLLFVDETAGACDTEVYQGMLEVISGHDESDE